MGSPGKECILHSLPVGPWIGSRSSSGICICHLKPQLSLGSPNLTSSSLWALASMLSIVVASCYGSSCSFFFSLIAPLNLVHIYSSTVKFSSVTYFYLFPPEALLQSPSLLLPVLFAPYLTYLSGGLVTGQNASTPASLLGFCFQNSQSPEPAKDAGSRKCISHRDGGMTDSSPSLGRGQGEKERGEVLSSGA